jgi:hypothetical protein
MRSVGPHVGRRVVPLTLLTMLLTFGCGRVTQADLVGNWALTEESRKHLPADVRTMTASLNLVSDGTFTAVELPSMRVESSGVVVFTQSGRGTWKILTLGGTDKVLLIFADNTGAEFEISTFLESEPKLYYFLTDPDLGQRLELVRSGAPTSGRGSG